jgi:3-deoxy-D-manno-octulosonate 8-phosphate phosphatase (KDO 8-P phosphatase)
MNLSAALEKITTIILDIDGVMTDGKLLYAPDFTTKSFDAQDGHAIKMALREGYKVGVISGRADPVNVRRIEELGMSFAYYGQKRKIDALRTLLNEQGLSKDECLFVGDDVIDMPVMRAVSVGVAVQNAVAEVKQDADWICERNGGDGAIREVIVAVMKAGGKWDKAMERYYRDEEI